MIIFKMRNIRVIISFCLSLTIGLVFIFETNYNISAEMETEEGYNEYVCNNYYSFEASDGQLFEFSLIKQVPEGLENPEIKSLSIYETIGLYFRKNFSVNNYISWSELSSPTIKINLSIISGTTNFLLGKISDLDSGINQLVTGDINKDGTFDILDLIIGKKNLFNNPLSYLYIDGKSIDISLLEKILKIKSNVSSEFKILNSEISKFIKTPLEQALYDIELEDLSIPKFDNSDNKYELKEYIFTFKNNEKYYAYTLLADTELELTELILNPVSSIKGLHIWEIKPEEGHDRNVISFTTTTELPDTTGKNFEYMSQTYSYKLKNFPEVNRSTISKICSLIDGTAKWYSSSYTYIQYYDYNIDGKLTQEDLNIILQNWTSRPDIVFYNYSSYLSRIISGINLKNYVISLDSIIEPYDFVVPTQEYITQNNLGYVSEFQLIPIERFYDVTGELLNSSQDFDYFLLKNTGDSFKAHPVLLNEILSNNSILGLRIIENDEIGNKIYEIIK
ncbi:MAG TPA: hypothetical protein PK993_05880 [Clostridia bacterium]|nr:hypothetical protein [Clostridia bacterium]